MQSAEEFYKSLIDSNLSENIESAKKQQEYIKKYRYLATEPNLYLLFYSYNFYNNITIIINNKSTIISLFKSLHIIFSRNNYII